MPVLLELKPMQPLPVLPLPVRPAFQAQALVLESYFRQPFSCSVRLDFSGFRIFVALYADGLTWALASTRVG